uniref:hypothetical protein n=1 Tax=Burkholderia sp. Ac-20379 TaxID=2703900 RepID=UPI00197F05D7
GTLALGGAGSLLSTGAVSLAGSGASFEIAGANGDETIGSLSGGAGSTVGPGIGRAAGRERVWVAGDLWGGVVTW